MSIDPGHLKESSSEKSGNEVKRLKRDQDERDSNCGESQITLDGLSIPQEYIEGVLRASLWMTQGQTTPESSDSYNPLITLQQLRDKRIQESENGVETQPNSYIEVECGVYSMCQDDSETKGIDKDVSVRAAVKDLLLQDEIATPQILLLLGPSGSGKTTALGEIERGLWWKLNLEENTFVSPKRKRLFPILFELSSLTLNSGSGDLRIEVLNQLGFRFPFDDLRELQMKYSLEPVWLLDGFDEMEMSLIHSLRKSFSKCGRVVVTCCQQFAETILKDKLSTCFASMEQEAEAPTLHIRSIRPLSHRLIETYLKQTMSAHPSYKYLWCAGSPGKAFGFPHFSRLARSPFLLGLIGQSLENSGSVNSRRMAPFWIQEKALSYSIEQCLRRCFEKFQRNPNWPQDWSYEDFADEWRQICGKIAWEMFRQSPSTFHTDSSHPLLIDLFNVNEDPIKSEEDWKKSFLLRAIPLQKTDSSNWAFLNKSLRGYFVASEMHRNPETLKENLGLHLFAREKDLLQIFSEVVANAPHLIEVYRRIILSSRQTSRRSAIQIAAANAISILNYGAVSGLFANPFFTFKDWSGICIPGANLSLSQMHDCIITGVDLSNGSMWRASLVGADLSEANLDGMYTDEEYELKGPASSVSSVCFSPDGKLLASGSDDKTIRLWNVSSKTCAAEIQVGSKVHCVNFSPDGKMMASGSEDGVVRLWDVASRRCESILSGFSQGITHVCFSPGGATVASCSTSDKIIRLWDVASRRCTTTLKGHTRGIVSICFSPDGKTLVSGSDDNTVRFWHIASGECQRTEKMKHPDNLVCSPDSQLLAICLRYLIELWDIERGKLVGQLSGSHSIFESICFSPDGKVLVSSDSDSGNFKFWDVAARQCIVTLEVFPRDVSSFCFSPDGLTMAIGSGDNMVRLRDVSVVRCMPTLTNEGIDEMHFSPDGKALVCDGADKSIRLWDVPSGVCTRTFLEYTHLQRGTSFSSDGRIYSCICRNESIQVWVVKSGKRAAKIVGPINPRLAQLSPDGKVLALVFLHSIVQLWDVTSGKCLGTMEKQSSSQIWRLLFSPDGQALAFSFDDRSIGLWDITSGRWIALFPVQLFFQVNLCFSPDGRILASCCDSKTLWLWDVSNGECLLNVRFFSHKVWAICFSPDSKTLMVAFPGHRIELWDVKSGRKFSTFEGHNDVLERSENIQWLDSTKRRISRIRDVFSSVIRHSRLSDTSIVLKADPDDDSED